jgi:hypothetical protein
MIEINLQANQSIERAKHRDEHIRLTSRLNPSRFSQPLLTPKLDEGHGYELKASGNDDYLSPRQAREIVDTALSQGHQPIWNPVYQIESPKGRFSYHEERKEDPFAGQESLTVDKLLYKITSQYR